MVTGLLFLGITVIRVFSLVIAGMYKSKKQENEQQISTAWIESDLCGSIACDTKNTDYANISTVYWKLKWLVMLGCLNWFGDPMIPWCSSQSEVSKEIRCIISEVYKVKPPC